MSTGYPSAHLTYERAKVRTLHFILIAEIVGNADLT
jgi:hypothetical protein